MPPARLKRRADFVHAAKGRRTHEAALTLQANGRGEASADASGAVRFGFTVTKKVGNAVERNRIRRRLREVVRLSRNLSTVPGTDYVVVARRDALSTTFGRLVEQVERAVRRSAGEGGSRKGRPRPPKQPSA